MIAPRIASLAVALVLTASADVVAQQRPLVAPGAKVRVSAPDFELVGTAAGLKPDTLLVESRGGSLAVPLAAVAKLKVYRGRKSRVGRGALIGLLSGAVVGAVLGAVTPCEGEYALCFDDPTADAALGGAVLGAFGAGVGALVGAVIRTDRWEVVPLEQLRVGSAPGHDPGLTLSVSLRL